MTDHTTTPPGLQQVGWFRQTRYGMLFAENATAEQRTRWSPAYIIPVQSFREELELGEGLAPAVVASPEQLLESLDVMQQALREMRHAHFNPGWFTKGESGAMQQFLLWHRKGSEAVEAAIALTSPSTRVADHLEDGGKATGWRAFPDEVPKEGTRCLVYSREHEDICIDTWQEQHEAPLSFSSATTPIGLGWDDHSENEVLFWQPLPKAPADPQRIAIGMRREGETK